jgi:pyrroline-5-carboxylate reductase
MVEYGVVAEFNNERLFLECDLIFICVQPGQASEVFKEVKHIVDLRIS